MTNDQRDYHWTLVIFSFFLLRRRFAELFLGAGPGVFLALADRFPGAVHQGDVAAPFAFAVIESRLLAAAALAFALVARPTVVMGDRGTVALAAAVVFAGGALPLAVVEAAAEVLFAEGRAGGRGRFIGTYLWSAAGETAGDQTADGGGGELIELATAQRLGRHG